MIWTRNFKTGKKLCLTDPRSTKNWRSSTNTKSIHTRRSFTNWSSSWKSWGCKTRNFCMSTRYWEGKEISRTNPSSTCKRSSTNSWERTVSSLTTPLSTWSRPFAKAMMIQSDVSWTCSNSWSTPRYAWQRCNKSNVHFSSKMKVLILLSRSAKHSKKNMIDSLIFTTLSYHYTIINEYQNKYLSTALTACTVTGFGDHQPNHRPDW